MKGQPHLVIALFLLSLEIFLQHSILPKGWFY